MIELNKIYNEDCLIGMQRIPDGSVDAIICDLPYGTMKGAALDGWVAKEDQAEWDDIIPTDKLFEQYERVLRRGGTAVLFSQEPYTSHLRTYKAKNMFFCYPMIWKKDIVGNPLLAKKAPLGYFEDINVFTKEHDSQFLHPLRAYFDKMNEYVGGRDNILNEFGGHRGRCKHSWGCTTNSQFGLCTKETYDLVVKRFHIDQMQGFRTYENLRVENEEHRALFKRVFNLPEGANSMSNVLDFKKDTDTFHPTQKPMALMQRLVLTYTNEGDTVLDNTCGSGTTCIACIREKRNFIGFELNREYYDKACKRIELERMQPSLF